MVGFSWLSAEEVGYWFDLFFVQMQLINHR